MVKKKKKGHHKGTVCSLKRQFKLFWLFFYKIESKPPRGSFHTYQWGPVSVRNGQRWSAASDAAALPGNGINFSQFIGLRDFSADTLGEGDGKVNQTGTPRDR